jgi:signal transduction histidine kinase
MQGIKKRWVRTYLLIVMGVALILQFAFLLTVRSFYYNYVYRGLENHLTVTTGFYEKYLQQNHYTFDEIAQLIVKDFEDGEFVELQVLDLNGEIKYSSTGFLPEKQVITEDFTEAMAGKEAKWIGRNPDTKERLMAITGTIRREEGNAIAAIRYVSSLTAADAMVYRAGVYSSLANALVLILMWITSAAFSRSILNPIRNIISVSKHMAEGDLTQRIPYHYKDEIGELCETINYMADQLQHSETMKNEFISSISHEIRTPLTAIAGWGETILTGGFEDMAQVERGLSVILRETDRLSVMVSELLDFSRMENGRFTLYLEDFRLDQELLEIVEMYRPNAEKEGVQLEVHFNQQEVFTEGDSNRLRQVFINLLDNAIKFTPTGKSVKIYLTENKDDIVVTIEDEGVGMGKDELRHAKDKFYKGISKKSGSGLGLAICDEIVELHGGRLNIDSAPGKGTRVRIILPK